MNRMSSAGVVAAIALSLAAFATQTSGQEPTSRSPTAGPPEAAIAPAEAVSRPAAVKPAGTRHSLRPAYLLATVGLRSGSGANYELIQVVPEGSMVGVATCSAGWCATVWKGRRGYAPTSALSIAPASPDGTYPPYADEPVAYHGGSGDDDQRPNISVGAAFDITFGYGPHSRWRRRW